MYRLGTLEEFISDEGLAKAEAGWTKDEIKNGKVVKDENDEEYIKTDLLPKRQNPSDPKEFLWESPKGDTKDAFNILASWSRKISGHKSTKYYIAQRDKCSISNKGSDCFLCGEVGVGQVLSFGLGVCNIKIFDSKGDYLTKASELAIELGDLEI